MSQISLPHPLAFVFSAGAARAAAQVGMLAAVLDAGLVPDLIFGTSTGAINASVFAAHPVSAVDQLVEVWSDIASDSSLTSTWRSAIRGVTGSQSVRTADMLAEHLADPLGTREFRELATPLHLVATDLSTGMPVSLDSGVILDSLMASCAFPVMLPPVTNQGRNLTDGSVSAGIPVAQAITLGAKSIVLFDTGASAVPESATAEIGWYSVMALAFSHLVRGRAAHDLAQVAQTIPVIVISCDQGSPIDLKATPSLIGAGRRIAQDLLAALPPLITEPGIYGIPIGLEHDEGIEPLLR